MAKGSIAALLISLGLDVKGVKTGTDQAGGIVEKFAGQAESKLSRFSGGFDKAGKGALALGGTISGVAATLNGLAEPLERSEIDLETMIKNTGRNVEDFRSQIDATVRTEQGFGHAQADTEESLAHLTAAFQDPQKALKEMSLVQELAAYKHISLTEAADMDIKMHAGGAKIFKEFGINVKEGAQLIAAATKAEQADQTASEALAKAKQHLADLHAELAGKTHLTVSEQISLRNATNAVRTAQTAATGAHQASIKAQSEAKNATADYGAVIDKQLKPRLSGLAEAQSHTFGAQFEAYRTRVLDFAANLGKTFGPQLQVAGAGITGLGGLIEGSEAIGRGTEHLRKFVGEHVAAAAKASVAWIGHSVVFVAQSIYRGARGAVEGILHGAQALASAARASAAWAAHTAVWIAQSGIRLARAGLEAAQVGARAAGAALAASARWIAHTAVFLAQSAVRLGVWALEQARTLAGALATAAVVAGTWIAGTAVFLAQQAIRLAAWLAANTVMVATAIATGIAAAAAFLLPLAPFILIGLAVAGLVILVVTHFSQIRAFITSVVGNVVAFVGNAFHQVTNAIAGVLGWVRSNWPLLLAILTGPVGLAVLFVVSHFSQIRNIAATVINDVKGFFSSLPGHVAGVVASVVGWFAGLPGRILGALGNLGGMLVNAGTQIIAGLLSGITSKFEDVKNFVGGIGSWIASHKGPLEVDRQLLQPHGLAFMEGFHLALIKGFAPVQSFVRGVGAGVASMLGVGAPTVPSAPGLTLGSTVAPAIAPASRRRGPGGDGGGGAGFTMVNHVYNPKAEAASTSLNRELRKVGRLRRAYGAA